MLDTGVMYRAVTLAALRRGLSTTDEAAVSDLAENLEIDVRPASRQDGRQYDVYLEEEDVTWEVLEPAVDREVSRVSAYPRVRKAMTDRQREIGRRGGVVMVGRDIGTVVLPDADLKIYLDASTAERARRRFEERLARGEEVEYEEVLASMRKRDRLDTTRELAPLKRAQDAVLLDSSGLTIDEMVAKARAMVESFEDR